MTDPGDRLAGLHVLVVDDDPDVLGAMSIALRAGGASVEQAEDGGAALHRLLGRRPDAVVLDMMLPVQSGFTVLERCRSLERPVPVVMVTANQGRRHAALADGLGASAYLVKPVPLAKLIEVVAAAAGR